MIVRQETGLPSTPNPIGAFKPHSRHPAPRGSVQHFLSNAARLRLFANSSRHTLAARGIKRYSFGKKGNCSDGRQALYCRGRGYSCDAAVHTAARGKGSLLGVPVASPCRVVDAHDSIGGGIFQAERAGHTRLSMCFVDWTVVGENETCGVKGRADRDRDGLA
jgi:hypothetical protein